MEKHKKPLRIAMNCFWFPLPLPLPFFSVVEEVPFLFSFSISKKTRFITPTSSPRQLPKEPRFRGWAENRAIGHSVPFGQITWGWVLGYSLKPVCNSFPFPPSPTKIHHVRNVWTCFSTCPSLPLMTSKTQPIRTRWWLYTFPMMGDILGEHPERGV